MRICMCVFVCACLCGLVLFNVVLNLSTIFFLFGKKSSRWFSIWALFLNNPLLHSERCSETGFSDNIMLLLFKDTLLFSV